MILKIMYSNLDVTLLPKQDNLLRSQIIWLLRLRIHNYTSKFVINYTNANSGRKRLINSKLKDGTFILLIPESQTNPKLYRSFAIREAKSPEKIETNVPSPKNKYEGFLISPLNKKDFLIDIGKSQNEERFSSISKKAKSLNARQHVKAQAEEHRANIKQLD